MKSLQEYFNEATPYYPGESIIQEFSKEEMTEFVEVLLIRYKTEIRKYQTMDYNNDEFDGLVTIIDKISKFQTLVKEYDTLMRNHRNVVELMNSVHRVNYLIDDIIQDTGYGLNLGSMAESVERLTAQGSPENVQYEPAEYSTPIAPHSEYEDRNAPTTYEDSRSSESRETSSSEPSYSSDTGSTDTGSTGE